MTAITGARKFIQEEETQFRAAVSESTWQKIGGSINFINSYQYTEKQFYVNGAYSLLTLPYAGIDGITMMIYNATVIGAFMFSRLNGTGGTTSLDIKKATNPGGTFTSIFSTPPAISYLSGGGAGSSFNFCYTGSAFANTTAPVIGTPNLNAGDVIRCDILSSMTGDPRGAGIVLFYQPR